MSQEQFQAFAQPLCRRIEKQLEQHLPATSQAPDRLHQAMRYAVLNGGKRMRPLLCYATAQALSLPPEAVDEQAIAIECMHCYSLVHDDLPAMDNDDLRRGQPTCHIAFDEATAILAGDALQTLAFQIIGNSHHSEEQRVQMVVALAQASGSRGMAGGQSMDLAATGRQLDLAQLQDMHIHKTGALVRASVKLAWLVDRAATARQTRALEHYAKSIGLAFQIRDDILDVEGDTEITGKTQGRDAEQQKNTYPALLGLTEARRMMEDLHQGALQALDAFDERADPLRWIADFIVARHN